MGNSQSKLLNERKDLLETAISHFDKNIIIDKLMDDKKSVTKFNLRLGDVNKYINIIGSGLLKFSSNVRATLLTDGQLIELNEEEFKYIVKSLIDINYLIIDLWKKGVTFKILNTRIETVRYYENSSLLETSVKADKSSYIEYFADDIGNYNLIYLYTIFRNNENKLVVLWQGDYSENSRIFHDNSYFDSAWAMMNYK